jgi:hypothetical protein
VRLELNIETFESRIMTSDISALIYGNRFRTWGGFDVRRETWRDKVLSFPLPCLALRKRVCCFLVPFSGEVRRGLSAATL